MAARPKNDTNDMSDHTPNTAPTSNASDGGTTLVVDELRLGRGLELCHDGRRASKYRSVRTLATNRYKRVLGENAFCKQMFPRDTEPLSLRIVLNSMAKLSCILVVSLDHVRVRVLRYRLELNAVSVCKLRSLIRFER